MNNFEELKVINHKIEQKEAEVSRLKRERHEIYLKMFEVCLNGIKENNQKR